MVIVLGTILLSSCGTKNEEINTNLQVDTVENVGESIENGETKLK